MKLFTKYTLFDLIDELVPQEACIVEAGAFDGKDSERLVRWRPHGHIHAFEPVPEIFQLLCRNTGPYPRITCYPYALSNQSGLQKFYLSEHPRHPGKPFQAGSLCEPKERLHLSPVTYSQTLQVQTVTLDEWAEQHAIERIDFLWLDVQGHALPILQAATRMLQRISLLHVEVEFVHAYENQELYLEVVHWLELQGFQAIGKDFSTTTDWFFGNVVLKGKV